MLCIPGTPPIATKEHLATIAIGIFQKPGKGKYLIE
jgi:hypothetical protein